LSFYDKIVIFVDYNGMAPIKGHKTNLITVLSKRADRQSIWPYISTLATRIENRKS